MEHEKMINDGEYNGCRNCRNQPEPMKMCEWGKKRQRVELICSRWEKKDGRFNQQTVGDPQ